MATGSATSLPLLPWRRGRRSRVTRKAVHGHMRVHQGEKQEKGRPSMHLALGWASTGKRVGNGNSRAVTVAFAPKEEAVDNSRAIVLAVPQPQPTAAAARTEPIHDGEHTTIMVAEANPPNQFVYHDHLPAAAPYVGGANHHVPPQPAAAPVQPLALFPEAAQAGGPYRCKFEGCNMEYKTHQGLGVALGGHMRAHYNGKVEKPTDAEEQDGGSD
ncbi:hypothetical protein E2562_021228 [Oryza meyeriana var. granulata]|uniref:C2H2-type domain-containing protein n=1 Tax=Oryza meyeriana var. granulata TaxID=110450 RepID=A0A6G1DYZ1_9ORYZ|nr:hypothetical protein E2562_021228 [Oryza meyeriana var. granulata]